MEINKFKKFTLKNLIKSTNSPRLQSLRLPRDLSLGGTKEQQPKRVYKPNINAVRNRTKNEKRPKCNEKLKNNFKKDVKSLERFVQSTGIFSEGIGPNLPRYNRNENKCVLSETKSFNKLDISKQVKTKTRHSLLNSPPNEIKFEESDSETDEKLPFVPNDWSKYDKSMTVKTEIQDHVEQLPLEYKTETGLTCPTVSIWQLPDSFACSKAIDQDAHLKDMPEGQIGKIIVRQSGKIEISIAQTKFVLNTTVDSFSEDVVCLNKELNKCFVISEVKNRFILNPDWNILL